MHKTPLLIIALICCGNALASSVRPTKITKILVGPNYGNTVFITTQNKPTARPECHTNPWYDFAFDGTTESGKMTLSVALAAYTAQKNLWVGGSDTCSIYGGVEDLNHIVTE